MFKDKKIDVTGLEIQKENKTFFWSGKYHTDMNTRDTIDTQLNVLATFNPIVPQNWKNADFLMLGNLMPKLQLDIIKQMSTRPKLIVMDTMNFWMETAADDLAKTIAEVDVLTINDAEARQLANEYSLVKAAQKILSMGPKYLIIKKGEHGALLFNKDQVFFAPALPLEEVFDPTGAGDTFAGGFIGYLAETRDISFDNMKRAVIFGSAMASFCVEKFGTQRLEELTQDEVDNRIQEFINLVQFDISLVNE
jgi:fructose-1-phosphate kinase PfkB-like protein